jgi:hypothetical protein
MSIPIDNLRAGQSLIYYSGQAWRALDSPSQSDRIRCSQRRMRPGTWR